MCIRDRYNPYVNSGKTKASGFDFDASTRFPIKNVGDMRIKLEGTYNLNYQTYSVADGKYNANINGNYDGGSRLILKLRPSLKAGAWDHGMTVHYASGFSNNSDSSPTYCVTQKVTAENMAACERVQPPTTVDYNLTYTCLLYTSPSPRDATLSRMPSSA